jgi:hypothetical protein
VSVAMSFLLSSVAQHVLSQRLDTHAGLDAADTAKIDCIQSIMDLLT